MNALRFSVRHYQLVFKKPFGIAHGIRTFTDTLYVRASFMGMEGFGEAALPPYLNYDAGKLVADFHSFFPARLEGSDAIRSVLIKLNRSGMDIPLPLRTAVDIALYDLYGKLSGRTVRSIFDIGERNNVLCSYTLGISSIDEMLEKIEGAPGVRLFKIKLGAANDEERVDAFKRASSADFCVDANQAWTTATESISRINRLKERGCLFVEQPMPVSMAGEYEYLYHHTSLPIILDESVQGLQDVEKVKGYCHGINIKLLKCGGLEPAVAMARQANKAGLKVLIGCMSESTCGAMAALQLSAWSDWIDLDGPLLIQNDPFSGAVYDEGRLLCSGAPGTGAVLKDTALFPADHQS